MSTRRILSIAITSLDFDRITQLGKIMRQKQQRRQSLTELVQKLQQLMTVVGSAISRERRPTRD